MSDQNSFENSRAFFEPLGFAGAPNDLITGTNGRDMLVGDPVSEPTANVPPALAFFTFDTQAGNRFASDVGTFEVETFRLEKGEAVPSSDNVVRSGPAGGSDQAMQFNGETSFAFLQHDPAFEITQGTIALWVQPDDVSDDAIILSKDEKKSGDGGHFRLGFEEDGRLFVRVANGDGGSNKAWETTVSYLSEGSWTHLAVSFSADGGVTVYVDGVEIPDFLWFRVEGNEDLPSLQSEAYILQNKEPWIIGADTSRTENNDTAEDFAADSDFLRGAFDGAISDFAIFGGMSAGDELTEEEIAYLADNPGFVPAGIGGPQPLAAGNDTINGGAGHDQIFGGAGNDELNGENGRDSIEGGYGDDILNGGNGHDTLDGGRGSDLLIGGAGNDVLIARSDAGEQRIGQLAIGEPSRDIDTEVNPDRQKLYGWEDQPLVADDILVGGEGRDTFLINPLINAKRDIILDHVNEDRTIDWGGVAGENNELHDHWVDSIGIDIIADYRAGEDSIVILGHTVEPRISYQTLDSGEIVSIITIISQQGNNGGAHDEDLIGQVVVRGDLVDLDDVLVRAKPTPGIVETVDELQEALAPSGDTKITDIDGETIYGYDTRDADGGLGPIMSDPFSYSDNPFLTSGLFEFASNVPADLGPANIILDPSVDPVLATITTSGNEDDGLGAAYVSLAHEGAVAALAQESGTLAFSFVADEVGGDWQALVSKDARTYVDGGHLSIWITDRGDLKLRYQSTEEDIYLYARDIDIEEGESYHVAFSFNDQLAVFYVNGEQVDAEVLSDRPSFAAGMIGNTESLIIGAGSSVRPSGTTDNLKDFFKGTVTDLTVFDRALLDVEILRLYSGRLDADVAQPASDGDDNDGEGSDYMSEDGSDDTGSIGTMPEGPSQEPINLQGTSGIDVLEGGDGHDRLNGRRGADELSGGDGDDTLIGGNGRDELRGEDGNDSLRAGGGRDDLYGGEGDDRLIAGNGRDTLNGGTGDDVLTGGRGRDIFIFEDDDGPTGADSITDFNPATDEIHVSADWEVALVNNEAVTRLLFTSADGEDLGSVSLGDVVYSLEQLVRIDLDTDL